MPNLFCFPDEFYGIEYIRDAVFEAQLAETERLLRGADVLIEEVNQMFSDRIERERLN